MQRLFAAVFAVTFAHGFGRGGLGRDPSALFGAPAPRMPAFGNRIPAPLPPPAQAPIINGPLSQPALRGM
jgi:hypothetical protein